ncbi:metallophosphoesterase family protein [Thermodesulfobacteriota bacterium]
MRIKIGVLSDTHLHRVTKDFVDLYNRYFSDADMILHAGDFVSEEVAAFLRVREFRGVCGNMDPIELRKSLPEKQIVTLGPFRIGLIHGWGPLGGLEERVRSEFEKVDVIIYGHSHRAVNHVKDGVRFFNPGTASGFSFSGNNSIGIIEISDQIHGELIPVP